MKNFQFLLLIILQFCFCSSAISQTSSSYKLPTIVINEVSYQDGTTDNVFIELLVTGIDQVPNDSRPDPPKIIIDDSNSGLKFKSGFISINVSCIQDVRPGDLIVIRGVNTQAINVAAGTKVFLPTDPCVELWEGQPNSQSSEYTGARNTNGVGKIADFIGHSGAGNTFQVNVNGVNKNRLDQNSNKNYSLSEKNLSTYSNLPQTLGKANNGLNQNMIDILKNNGPLQIDCNVIDNQVNVDIIGAGHSVQLPGATNMPYSGPYDIILEKTLYDDIRTNYYEIYDVDCGSKLLTVTDSRSNTATCTVNIQLESPIEIYLCDGEDEISVEDYICSDIESDCIGVSLGGVSFDTPFSSLSEIPNFNVDPNSNPIEIFFSDRKGNIIHEVELNVHISQDTDGDGYCDEDDCNPYDPLAYVDSDGDGLCDIVETCTITFFPELPVICNKPILLAIEESYPDIVWYDSNGIQVGEGQEIEVGEAGTYTVNIESGTCSEQREIEVVPNDQVDLNQFREILTGYGYDNYNHASNITIEPKNYSKISSSVKLSFEINGGMGFAQSKINIAKYAPGSYFELTDELELFVTDIEGDASHQVRVNHITTVDELKDAFCELNFGMSNPGNFNYREDIQVINIPGFPKQIYYKISLDLEGIVAINNNPYSPVQKSFGCGFCKKIFVWFLKRSATNPATVAISTVVEYVISGVVEWMWNDDIDGFIDGVAKVIKDRGFKGALLSIAQNTLSSPIGDFFGTVVNYYISKPSDEWDHLQALVGGAIDTIFQAFLGPGIKKFGAILKSWGSDIAGGGTELITAFFKNIKLVKAWKGLFDFPSFRKNTDYLDNVDDYLTRSGSTVEDLKVDLNKFDDGAETFLDELADTPASGHWDENPFQRGNLIETDLGQNLPQTFKTIDKFDFGTGVATSIKSLDIDAKTYQNVSKLKSRLRKYKNELRDFTGHFQENVGVGAQFGNPITAKKLELAIPHNGKADQMTAIEEIIVEAAQDNIEFIVILFP